MKTKNPKTFNFQTWVSLKTPRREKNMKLIVAMWFCIVRLHECLPFFSHMGLFWNACPSVWFSHSIKLILVLEDLTRSNKNIFINGNDILDIYSNSLIIIHVTLCQLHCRQTYWDKYSVHLLFPCYNQRVE